jgi:hypothetical protein
MDALDLFTLRYVYTALYIAHEMDHKAQSNALDVLKLAGYVLAPGERATDAVQRLDAMPMHELQALLRANGKLR